MTDDQNSIPLNTGHDAANSHVFAQISQDNTRDAQITYRYVRVAMMILVTALFVAVTITSIHYRYVLHSLSAYYYSPARNVFVGSMCAIGTGLIIYKGRLALENVALNFAGFMGIALALAPKDPLSGMPEWSPTESQLFQDSVQISMATLIVTAVMALLVRSVLALRSKGRDRGRHVPRQTPTWAIPAGLIALVAVYLSGFWFWEDLFIDKGVGHHIAGISFFAGTIAVVLINALPHKTDAQTSVPTAHTTHSKAPHTEDGNTTRRRVPGSGIKYWVIFGLMIVVLITSIILKLAGWEFWLLFLESVIIALFGGFWLAQTANRWGPSTHDLTHVSPPASSRLGR